MRFDPVAERREELVARLDRAYDRLCAAQARLQEAVAQLKEFGDHSGVPVEAWLAARYGATQATVARWTQSQKRQP